MRFFKYLSLSMVMLLASCSIGKKSYLSEASFPSNCQGSNLTNLRLRLQICTAGEPSVAGFDSCFTTLRPLINKLPAACRASLDTQALVAAGIKDVAKASVRFGYSQAVAPDYDLSSVNRWVYTWLRIYADMYRTGASNNPSTANITGLEYNLSEVTSEILNSQHNATLVDLKNLAKATGTASKTSGQLLLDQSVRLLKSAALPAFDNQSQSLYYSFLLGQTLRNLKADVAPLIAAHDMVCSLTKCDDRDSLPAVIRTLASIPNAAAFRVNLTNLAKVGFAADGDSTYIALFQVMMQSQATIEKTILAAVRDLSLPDDASTNFSNFSFGSARVRSNISVELLDGIQFWQDMVNRYDQTGLFNGDPSGSLNYSFNANFLQDAQDGVVNLQKTLKEQKSSFEANRDKLINIISSSLTDSNQQVQNEASIASLEDQARILGSDISGLEQAIQKQDETLNGFAGHIESLKSTAKADNDFKEKFVLPEVRDIAATDARYNRNSATTLVPENYSVKAYKLAAGEILRLDVNGSWSPVCALRNSGLAAMDFDALQTGPDGYSLSFGDSSASVVATSEGSRHSNYKDAGTSSADCSREQVSGGAGGSFYGATGSATSGYERSRCDNTSEGVRDETYSSIDRTKSVNQSKSANFNGLLRLNDTPFKNMPGGALLAFIMDQSNPNATISESLDTILVSNRATIIAPKDAIVYLVVNDCLEGNRDLQKLQLSAQILQPAAAEIAALAPSLFARIKDFRTQSREILAEGIDISRQLQDKKQEINSAALRDFPNLTKLPALQQVFNFFLDHEAVQTERQALIEAKRREITRLTAETRRALLADEGFRSAQFMNQTRLKLLFENFDSNLLGYTLTRAANHVTRDFAPVLTFYVGRKVLHASLQESAQKILGALKLGQPLTQVSDTMTEFLEEFETGTKVWPARLDFQPTTRVVAVRIPHPFRQAIVEKMSPFSTYRDLDLPTPSEAVSKAFWEALLSPNPKQLPSITPTFEDLYRATGDGALDCNQTKAVIEDSALMFVTQDGSLTDETLNNLNKGRAVKPEFGPEVRYLGENGAQSYQIDPGQLGGSMKIGFLRLGTAEEGNPEGNTDGGIFKRDTNSNAGRGLSPFTSVSFDKVRLQSYFSSPGVAQAIGMPISSTDPVGGTGPGLGRFARKSLTPDQLPTNLTDIILLYKVQVRGNSTGAIQDVRTCKTR